jgi:hypothetical protein
MVLEHLIRGPDKNVKGLRMEFVTPMSHFEKMMSSTHRVDDL